MPHHFARHTGPLFSVAIRAIAALAIACQFGPLLAMAQDDTQGPAANGLKLQLGDQPDSETAADATDDAAEPLPELPEEVVKKGIEAKDEFLAVRKELTDSLIEMRRMHTHFINGEEDSSQAKAEYRARRTKTRRLMDKLFDAGLEVIRWVPDKEAATFLVTWIQHRLEHDFYDETTVEAGARLIDGSINMAYMFSATARSAIATGDFTIARKLYESMDEEHLEDLDRGFVFNATTLETQFEKESKQRKIDAEKDINPRVKVLTTRGDVVFELYIEQAPSAVANFIELAESGFYDGLDFYQVVDDLLALTGDDTGNGTGNTGKFLLDECDREDARQPLAGSLVMAKSPVGDTGEFMEHSSSCQFAILYVPIPKILGQQVVFGRVIEGMDSICALRRVDPSKKKEKGEIQLPPDHIISMEVIRRPDVLPEIKYFDLGKLDPHAGHDHDAH